MKIQQNITVFAGDTQSRAQAENENAGKSGAQENKSNTIYAGNLMENLTLRDRIQQKKEQAQQRVLKIINDAWDGDKEIEKSIGESRDHIQEYQANYQDAQQKVNQIVEERKKLRENHHIAEDSQEQKDLDLLEKARVAANHPWSGTVLTDEEKERLAKIEDKGPTEYQKQQLELSDTEWRYRESADRAEQRIQMENAVIRGIRGERRKHHPMANAQREAKEVLEAARDEIIGMVMQEAKDHVDEEQEKREEISEAIEEKKEEREEILEKRKEREEELEELIEELPIEEAVEMENVQDEIRQEIQNMMTKMGLVAEDLKGAKVDTSV